MWRGSRNWGHDNAGAKRGGDCPRRPLCAVALLVAALPAAPALAEGEALLLAAADAGVAEHRPDSPPDSRAAHVLSAGLSRGRTVGRSVSFLRFELAPLPVSTPLHSLVIEEARLSLMATSFGLAGEGARFLVTLSSCDAGAWDEAEITWREPPCGEEAESETSVIVDGGDLPRSYQWEVTRGIARAAAGGAAAVTFRLSAVRLLDCARDPFEGRGCAIDENERVGFVRFASRERADFGIGAVPHAVVRHTTDPTLLSRMVEVTLSVMSAFALTFGVYRTLRRVFAGNGAEA